MAVAASVNNARPPAVSEQTLIARFDRLRKIVRIQTWVMAALALVLVAVAPLAQPINLYYALTPEKTVKPLVGLTMPNMTNRAVLSWSTTAITGIMTMGFGDMDTRLPAQKGRFTQEGWSSFIKAFTKQEIGKTIKQNQLVLTTVPSNTPVIIAQGVNADQIYQWIVQMPVIMTYATNNNKTAPKSAIITLTITRVPAAQSPDGIAIQSWISS